MACEAKTADAAGDRRRRGRSGRYGAVLGIAIGLALAAPGWLQAEETPTVGKSTSVFGAYLSGRLAADERDPERAAVYFRHALEVEPGNETILKQAFLAEAQAGNWSRARALAPRIVDIETNHRLARVYLGSDAFRKADYAEAEKQFKEAAVGPIGELTAALARAWTKAALKDSKGATEALDALPQADWAKTYRGYHEALIADFLGEKEASDKAFLEVFNAEPRTLRVALAYAAHASASGDSKRAEEILAQHIQATMPAHPIALQMLADVKAGKRLTPIVQKPADGLAEVYYGLGEALSNEGGLDLGMIYLHLALELEPEFPLALAALAGTQEQSKQYESAIRTYARIRPPSPIAFSAGIRQALNLNVLDRVDESKSVLLGLLAGPDPIELEDAVTAASGPAPSVVLEELGTLQQGGKGEGVRTLQNLLAKAGLYSGPVDGLYGRSTADAVRKLQGELGLPVNGVFGPKTRKGFAERLGPGPKPAVKRGMARELQVYTALGNILRARQSFQEAEGYYSKAIETIETPQPEHWSQFYSRGVCYERLKQWDKAEADFLKAIELDGEQPLVLNYLGYSWVDRNEHLDKGLDLIRKAVKLKSDDGYIVDSLGWAYYRMGQFANAVEQLERAVELRADDPVINDHLGDAYWRVGRTLEAKFQWTLALGLKPEPEEEPKIRAKLEKGLPEAASAATASAGSSGEKSVP